MQQLWEVGIENIYIDGSFVESKAHQGDIDGYFECPWEKQITGELEHDLNSIDPYMIWTWDCNERQEFVMIRTENEYRQTMEQVNGFKSRLEQKMEELRKMELSEEQIRRVTDPDRAFYSQMEAEAESYKHLCRGNEEEIEKYRKSRDIGKFLIALRIFRGLNQSELAAKLDVDPSQVSRDEKNEYHGISKERASRVLETLDSSYSIVIQQVGKEGAKLEYA